MRTLRQVMLLLGVAGWSRGGSARGRVRAWRLRSLSGTALAVKPGFLVMRFCGRGSVGSRAVASVGSLMCVATVCSLAASSSASAASRAGAAGSCSPGVTTTCTFGPTGSQDTLVVPTGVSRIHVVAVGAPGAVGYGGRAGGRGARVSGDVAVSPGQTLYVNVGGAPTDGGCGRGVDCVGGFNGGGSSTQIGGGGGGSSDVRTVSSQQAGSLSSRVIVAAGGGGSGAALFSQCDTLPPSSAWGGAGGDAGSDGGPGKNCGSIADSAGGAAGTASAGGAGDSKAARAGCWGRVAKPS